MERRTLLFLSIAMIAAALALFWSGGFGEEGSVSSMRQIRIVGSSTVFPFSASVAENFGQRSGIEVPIVESTGTGGGMKLFCAGVGENFPDVTNASRRIKRSEYKKCQDKGIDMTEVKIGFDGIVLANSKNGPYFKLSLRHIFQALAKRVPVRGRLQENPYRKWSDIDPALPAIDIEVLGPPPTSGTRDAFVEIAMEKGAQSFKMLAALRAENKKAFKELAHRIREDGAFVEAGENDNLIVQKLLANRNALGIFGFGFLRNNSDRLKGSEVGGVLPTYQNIARGDYEISRSLFFYVKKNHVGIVSGLEQYVKEFTREGAWGEGGYLSEKGLIPLPRGDREKGAREARKLRSLALEP